MSDEFQVPSSVDLSGGTAPITMVDDDELDYMLLKRYYDRSGLSNPLIHFSDGEVFIAHLRASKDGTEPMPALVLMDINMPGMSGLETLKIMRNEEPFRHLPVVMMLTSSNDPVDRERAIEVGANGYLVKPHDPKQYQRFFKNLAEG